MASIDTNNFQRTGSISNAHAGSEFERFVQKFFAKQGIVLVSPHRGVGNLKKPRKFDLGSEQPPIIIECNHRVERAMLYFHMRPIGTERCCYRLGA
jgi:hypothetical protein